CRAKPRAREPSSRALADQCLTFGRGGGSDASLLKAAPPLRLQRPINDRRVDESLAYLDRGMICPRTTGGPLQSRQLPGAQPMIQPRPGAPNLRIPRNQDLPMSLCTARYLRPLTMIANSGGARAASGHVAAAPPSSVMNLRREVIRSPRRRATK